MLSDIHRSFPSFAFVLLLSLSFGCQQPPTVDLERNKQVVRDFYAAIDAQDYERIGELWAADALVFAVGTQVGYEKEILMDLIRTTYASFPDYTHVIDEMYAEGNLVAVRLTFHGTHQGEYEGIPARGSAFTYGGAAFYTVRDGQLEEGWGVDDTLSLLRQIGVELMPVASEK